MYVSVMFTFVTRRLSACKMWHRRQSVVYWLLVSHQAGLYQVANRGLNVQLANSTRLGAPSRHGRLNVKRTWTWAEWDRTQHPTTGRRRRRPVWPQTVLNQGGFLMGLLTSWLTELATTSHVVCPSGNPVTHIGTGCLLRMLQILFYHKETWWFYFR